MAVGIGGVGRTPGQPPRSRRNFDKLGSPDSLINPNNAIQLNSNGEIVLLLAPGEPLTQTSSGLAVGVLNPVVKSPAGIGLSDRFVEEHDHAYSAPPVNATVAGLTQVAAEEAAEEAIVAAATLSWMGL